MFATIVACVCLGAADWNAEAKKELKSLEGDWNIVEYATNSKEVALEKSQWISVSVKGTRFTIVKEDKGEILAIDPSAATKTIDFRMLREEKSDYVNEAIYKFTDADTLILVVYLGEGKNRPGSFEVPKAEQTLRFTLKRAKS